MHYFHQLGKNHTLLSHTPPPKTCQFIRPKAPKVHLLFHCRVCNIWANDGSSLSESRARVDRPTLRLLTVPLLTPPTQRAPSWSGFPEALSSDFSVSAITTLSPIVFLSCNSRSSMSRPPPCTVQLHVQCTPSTTGPPSPRAKHVSDCAIASKRLSDSDLSSNLILSSPPNPNQRHYRFFLSNVHCSSI